MLFDTVEAQIAWLDEEATWESFKQDKQELAARLFFIADHLRTSIGLKKTKGQIIDELLNLQS
jgi:hypothetical protein